MASWQPAGELEERLAEALRTNDSPVISSLLQQTQLALPITAAAFAGEERPRWTTVTAEGRTWLLAYTSTEAMRLGTGNAMQHVRATSLPELAAGWPDHSWALAINPGLPIQVLLDVRGIARLAAPSLLEDREAEPTARMPLMQKLLRHNDVHEFVERNVTRVSGYCHQVVDVAHIATPAVLIEALGAVYDIRTVMNDAGSINLLRWPAVGLELYLNAIGGTDEASREAVDGWLVEEPPFVGLGFAPNVDQVIREYKVHGIELPHRATICELTDDGVVVPRAALDADLRRWVLVSPDEDDSADTEGETG